MTYDPNRTTVLPEMGFPITEELPAVNAGRSGGGGSGFLKIAAFLLVGAVIAIAAVLFLSTRQSNNTATGEPEAEPTPTTTASNENPAPTVVEVADTEPGFWQVTGVPDGLNVRSGPGTDNEIVGSLRAGDRHIFGTGERANVNGAQWTQILFGPNDTVGWVSSRFLVADTAPDPDAPTPTAVPATSGGSVVCFESDAEPNRVARLTIGSGNIDGVLLTFDGQTAIQQQVTGSLANGRAAITLTTAATGASSQGTWIFRPADVELGNGTILSVVNCATIAGQLPPG